MTDGLLALLDPALNIAKAILGVGGLIFVHELGHFIVGRWCGVRAEAFSIGFGPVIAKWQPGPTEYRLSIVPLGGYVKFLGENPDERDEPAPDSFHAATYPRKVAIMLAGVTMNAIAAFVLFVLAFRGGINVTPPVVGAVQHGSPAWVHGLEVGDEFLSIDRSEILQFEDLQQAVFLADEVELVIRRGGETLPPMRIRTARRDDGLHVLGVEPPRSAGTTFGVLADSPAAEAGFENGDEVLAVDDVPQTSARAAIALAESAGRATRWRVRRGDQTLELELAPATRSAWRVGVRGDGATFDLLRRGGPAEQAGVRPGDEPVTVGGTPVVGVGAALDLVGAAESPGPLVVRRGDERVEIPLPDGAEARASFAASVGARQRPLVVSPYPDEAGSSPAEAAGLAPLSTILEADGEKVGDIGVLQRLTHEAGEEGRPLELVWREPGGAERRAEVEVASVEVPAASGLGVAPASTVRQEKRILRATVLGLERTHKMLWSVLGTLGGLVTGKVSPKNLSGPLIIAKVSYDESESGWGEFLLFLGFISINLAVLNLLPIPVLDGGQLMVITVEKIRGRPLPENVLYGFQMSGLLMLLGLMVYVVWNDIDKLT